MRNLLLALVLVGALLFAGCAGSAPAPEKKETLPPAPPAAQNSTVLPAPPSEPAVNSTPPPEQNTTRVMPTDDCTVEFQKDASNIYLLMVKTTSQKKLTVECPDGKMAVQQGTLYFCPRLDLPNAAIAYLDGKECGRASFSRSSYEGKGDSKVSCNLLLAPKRIVAGQTTMVTLQAYTANQAQVTFLCGESEKGQKASGLIDIGQICKFSTPGTVQVYAAIDGKVCANALLEVFSTSKDCTTFGPSFERTKDEYVYRAYVAARGYNSNENIYFDCYGERLAKPLRDLPSSTDFVAQIECRGRQPLTAPISVKVGSESCGQTMPQSK